MTLDNSIDILKQALERRVGHTLNSVQQCRQLEKWLAKYDIHVSYSTLSRMFGLNRQALIPRKATLNALSTALGYADYPSFIKGQNISPTRHRYQNDLIVQTELYLESGQSESAVDLFIDAIQEDTKNSFLSLHLGKHFYADVEKYHRQLVRLSQREEGRNYFFQFFIDEDDLNGGCERSLSQIFYADADGQEAFFVDLFQARKRVMKGELLSKNQMKKWSQNISDQTAVHLLARWYELVILNEFLQEGKVKEQTIVGVVDAALKRLDLLMYESAECALVGRICRALIFTRSAHFVYRNHGWITACRQVVFGDFSDLEFQSAAQRFLQLGNNFLSNQQMICKSDWPNAYFTSQLFLQSPSSIQKNKVFFEKRMGISSLFLKQLMSV
jgi:hypothetical protein